MLMRGACWKKCRLGALLGFLWALAACRLYEPPRYARFTFAPGAPQTRVLMIGDSLTYYNDLPGMLQQFSVHEKSPIYIEQSTSPLVSLSFHWSLTRAVERIRTGRFDYVVLQDFSRRPAASPEDSLRDFDRFNKEVTRTGGQSIVFQNWTRVGLEQDYPALAATYARVIQRTGARLAPIGAAWKICAAEHGEIPLFLDDRHPTEAGSYLAACVLYDVLYQKKSADLPVDLPGPDLSPAIRQTLRGIADRAAAGGAP